MRVLRGLTGAAPAWIAGAAALVVLLLVAGQSVEAVVIASGDGTGNTTAPPDDPGFAHVGVLTGLSGIYLGNGWVLSARHVDEGQFVLGGTTYEPVPGSLTQLSGPGANPPDLMLIKINGDPGLPPLPLATNPPPLNSAVILIGHGRDRDQPFTYEGHDGWTTKLPFTIRWGTNEISVTSQPIAGSSQFGATETQSLATTF